MAVTIDELQIEIQSTSQNASSGVDSLVSSLNRLKSAVSSGLGLRKITKELEGFNQAVSKINTAKLDSISNLKAGFSGISSAVQDVSPTIDVSPAKETTAAFEEITSEAKRTSSALSSVASETKRTGFAFLSGAKHTNKFAASLKRIALYRFIRFILRGITTSMKEGIQNIAQYSKAIGGIDASHANETMSKFATISLQIKNTIGSALIPVLNALMPVIQTIAGWFISAANSINEFFAALSGAKTFTKATAVTQDYADSLNSATSATKALKNATLSIDELNILGKGNNLIDYSGMFEEAEIDSGIVSLARTIKETLGPIFTWVQDNVEAVKKTAIAIGTVLLGWKIASDVTSFFRNYVGNNSLKLAVGLTLSIVGFTLEFEGLKKILSGNATLKDYIITAIASALGVSGTALTLTSLGVSSGVAWTIGLTAMLSIGIAGITWKLATDTNMSVSQTVFYSVLNTALSGIIGAAVFTGFKIGTAGAGLALGLSFGALITVGALAFKRGVFENWTAENTFWTVLGGIIGGILGSVFLGFLGPAGTAIGIALGITVVLGFITFINKIADFVKAHANWISILTPILGAAIGFIFTGFNPIGGAIGLAIGLAISVGAVTWANNYKPSDAITDATKNVATNVTAYASGGYPSSGQLFIANESGPELVGKMGNHTAVANGGQIIEGIASGVASANAEQNALLIQQNNLLRQLVSKDSNIYLSGKKVNQQLQRQSRLSGNSLVNANA